MSAPHLERGPDVVVVQADEVLQAGRVVVEARAVYVVVEEEVQGGRGEEVFALGSQLLGTEQGGDEHRGDEHPLVGHGGLVQIYLPIHQAAGHEEVLDGVDAFLLDDEVVVLHVEHLDDARRADVSLGDARVEAVADARRADVSLGDARVEAVAAQVVQAVHVQLAADQLVEEALGILVLEYLDGQRPVHLAVDALHQQQGDVFVGDAAHDGVFQHVREGPVADVVHQDGGLDGFGFAVEDEVALGRQVLDGLGHQVEGAERVLEACMLVLFLG